MYKKYNTSFPHNIVLSIRLNEKSWWKVGFKPSDFNFCNWRFQFKIAGLKWNRQGAASSQCRRIDRMKRTPESAADRRSLYIPNPSFHGKCINCAKLGAAKLFMYHNPVGVLPARSVIIAICEILLQKSIWGIITTLLTASRVFNGSHALAKK